MLRASILYVIICFLAFATPPSYGWGEAQTQFYGFVSYHLQETGSSFRATDIIRGLPKPPDSLLKPTTMVAGIAELDEYYKSWSADQLLKDLSGPTEPKETPGGITIIALPGIFGEFFNEGVFQEVLDRQDSIFAQSTKTKLSSSYGTYRRLDEETDRKVKMNDLIQTASYDRKGRAWVNLVFLKAHLGSLETLGSMDSAVSSLLQRVDWVMRNFNGLGDVYLLGYSRGTSVALNIASAIHKAPLHV